MNQLNPSKMQLDQMSLRDSWSEDRRVLAEEGNVRQSVEVTQRMIRRLVTVRVGASVVLWIWCCLDLPTDPSHLYDSNGAAALPLIRL